MTKKVRAVLRVCDDLACDGAIDGEHLHPVPIDEDDDGQGGALVWEVLDPPSDWPPSSFLRRWD